MAELKANHSKKSKLTLKTLSFFLSSSNSSDQNTGNRYPKKFGEQNGVVGLGIVAALNNESSGQNTQNPVFSVSPRSNPIPIFSKKSVRGDDVEIELLEEYTCVISHVGNNLIKKREYFDNGFKRESGFNAGCTTSYWVSSTNAGGGVFCSPSPPVPVPMAVGGRPVFDDGDFLSCCYLCKKKLHGLDIFMYRGEKAFCSTECRYKQISMDEQKEKYVSGVRNEYSVSPCSSPMQFLAGVAAA